MSAVFHVWNSSGLLLLNTKFAFIKRGQGQHFSEKSSIRLLSDWSTERFEKPCLVPAEFGWLYSAAEEPPQPLPKIRTPAPVGPCKWSETWKGNGAMETPHPHCPPSEGHRTQHLWLWLWSVHHKPPSWHELGGPGVLGAYLIGAEISTLPFWLVCGAMVCCCLGVEVVPAVGWGAAVPEAWGTAGEKRCTCLIDSAAESVHFFLQIQCLLFFPALQCCPCQQRYFQFSVFTGEMPQ